MQNEWKPTYDTKINGITAGVDGLKKYFLDSPLDEKEAFIRGMYFKARRTKTNLQDDIQNFQKQSDNF